MKDYTFKKDKDFILNYKIKDNKIIIKYASGMEYENIYTRELEKDILEKMKNQVLNYEKKVNKIKSKRIFKDIITYFLTLLLMFSGNLIFLNASFLTCSLIGVGFLTITYFGYKIPRDNKLKDYEKNKFFIDNMELFQKGIKEEMGMYKNIDKKSQKQIKTILETKEALKKYDINDIQEPNINSINKISYKSLKNIHELLERNEEFSKYYNQEEKDTKKKVLRK